MSETETPEKPTREPLPDALQPRKPWPMWPIAISILLFVGVYTYINIEYRKGGSAFEPFAAARDRQSQPVEKNLYDWYLLKAQPAPDAAPVAEPAAASSHPNDRDLELTLPEQLVYYLPSRPVLLPFPVRAEAPAQLAAGESLRLRLWLSDALANDERFHLQSFYKEGQLFILPSLYVEELGEAADLIDGEPVPQDFALPTEPIEAGEVTARLLSEGFITEWKFRVAPAD